MNRLLLSIAYLASLFWATPVWADFGDCSSAAYVRSFDERLAASSCDIIETFAIRYGGRTIPMRVLRPAGAAHGADTLMVRHVEALANRLGPAMTAVGRVSLAPVSVMLTDLTLRDAGGAVHGVAEGRDATLYRTAGECRISIYKLPTSVPVQEFIFTHAHEIFHCVQFSTWLRQMNMQDAKWWVEGTAEYFAHLAQQGTSYGDWAFASFNRESNTRSILDMDYGNAVLFLWIAQRRGPSAIHAFIDAMATASGRGAQLAALRGAMPLEDWLRFGEEYFDGRVVQPGGRRVPPGNNIVEGTLRVRSSVNLTLTTQDAYVLTRREVLFESGRSYLLRAVDGGAGVRTRMGANPGGAWEDPPARVSACNELRAYRVLTTSIDRGGNHVLQVDAPERLAGAACCLIGKWSPTPAVVNALAQRTHEGVAMPGGGAVCRHGGGTWVLGFEGDNTGSVQWNGFSTVCTASGGKMNSLHVINGALQFSWRFERDHIFVTYTASNVTSRKKMALGRLQILDVTDPVDERLPGAHGVLQVCRGDSLQIKGLYSLPATSDYTRMRPPEMR